MQQPKLGHNLRLDSIDPPIIPIVQSWVSAYPGTISLGQGVVGYDPPAAVFDSLRTFGADPSDHLYGRAEGERPLLEAIRRKLIAENGLLPEASNELMVTAGSNMAFLEIALALLDDGDEVLLPLPYYFNHEMAIRMVGGCPVPVATDDHFQLDLDALSAAITPRTRAILTVSPNNPSGVVYPESMLRAVNQLCQAQGLYHISDEAYEHFTYDSARHFSPLSIPGSEDFTVGLYSLSKSHGMAGWRIGYMVIPSALKASLLKIQDTNLIAAPRPSQRAALAALETGRAPFEAHRDEFMQRRRAARMYLESLKGDCQLYPTQGAFYFLLKIDTAMTGLEVGEYLARSHGVATVPGEAFGLSSGCFLRIAYGALDSARFREGLARLARGIDALGRRP